MAFCFSCLPHLFGRRQKHNDEDECSKPKEVMGKYHMFTGSKDVIGKGTFSICYRGLNPNTLQPLAIKVYRKSGAPHSKAHHVTLQKFKRQIQTLMELSEPFVKPKDSSLWHAELDHVHPANLFMNLVDFSKDSDGKPGPDSDGTMYVVTELAQCSLKDLLGSYREERKKFSREYVKSLAKAILLIVAGLHAKGLVHLDLKPENIMFFDGHLKLIDLDGCIKIGTAIAISDSTVSFSPCYCAPEWAQFLVNGVSKCITASPALDVWSVGVTLCELVVLDSLLKPTYANYLRELGGDHQEAGFMFMDWVANIETVPLPESVLGYDSDLVNLLNSWLLVSRKANRKSCATSLCHPFVKGATPLAPLDEAPKRTFRRRTEDHDKTAPRFKGTLFKLNADGNPEKAAHWIKRDFWIAANGSLCYFSLKTFKRLVLIDASKLGAADVTISKFTGGFKQFAFKIQVHSDEGETKLDSHIFACDTSHDIALWMKHLKGSVRIDVPTMVLGIHGTECRQFILSVRNRRQAINNDHAGQYDPAYQGMLWKLKAEGDAMEPLDWFERTMWLSNNGSLVYYSPKEKRPLVYYMAADVLRASLKKLPTQDTCKPFAFEVHVSPSGGMEFAPGVFAANTEKDRDRWINEFKGRATKRRSSILSAVGF